MVRFLVAALAVIGLLAATDAYYHYSSHHKCKGKGKYKVTFHIRWTQKRFGKTVPDNAHVSPLTAAAHKKRYTPFAVYSYADKATETVAETGNNKMLMAQLRANKMVGDVSALSKPTSNNGPASVVLYANHRKGYTSVSAIAMLAPTPDWIVAINNINLCYHGYWVAKAYGKLYGIDAGTEKRIGVDQSPRQNIYFLGSPRYPRYEKMPVGYFSIKKIY